MNPNSKGFSLVELLVVVAIIGILAGVGIVGYNAYVRTAQEKVALANLEIVGRKLDADIIAVKGNLSSNSAYFQGLSVDKSTICELVAIQVVRNLNTTEKNPFFEGKNVNVTSSSCEVTDSGGVSGVAAYGNYMTSGTSPNFVQSTAICPGTIIVSCGNPVLPISHPNFTMYQCTCDSENAADCQFDNGPAAGGQCLIPSRSTRSSGNAYAP
jgi:prepilin-type N-terminal cleavage/methylation domain-containing protein